MDGAKESAMDANNVHRVPADVEGPKNDDVVKLSPSEATSSRESILREENPSKVQNTTCLTPSGSVIPAVAQPGATPTGSPTSPLASLPTAANTPPTKNEKPYTAFPVYRQRLILALVTAAGFLGPLAGGIYLPALPVLEREFQVSSTAINATVSAFMVVFAFGPLLWSYFADYKGRRPLYLTSLSVYILANISLATAPTNFAALTVLRIVQAFGAAAAVAMGAGSVADITPPAKRATAMSYFLLGPQCGPILGPVLGGLLAGEADWRWIFGFLAILAAAIWLLILLLLPETLRARVGNGGMFNHPSSRWKKIFILPPSPSSKLAPTEERGPPPPKPILKMYWKLLTTLPIFIVTMNTALLYSTYFCISVMLPTALEEVYGWDTTAIGFGFLAVGIAMVLGSLVGGRWSDWRRGRLVSRLNQTPTTPSSTSFQDLEKQNPPPSSSHPIQPPPESRLTDQIYPVLICILGCITFGFLVQHAVHPAVVLFATFVNGFGMSAVFISSTAFLTEKVQKQAAGAFALGNMMRNPGAGIGAAVIGKLVERMGWGWCFMGLGLLDLVVVGGGVLWLRRIGGREVR